MQLTPISKIKKQNIICHPPKDYKIKNSYLPKIKNRSNLPKQQTRPSYTRIAIFFLALVFQKKKTFNLTKW